MPYRPGSDLQKSIQNPSLH
jgi:hypothetical protein